MSEFINSVIKMEPQALVLVGAGVMVVLALVLGIRAVLVGRRTNVLDRLDKFSADGGGMGGESAAAGVLVSEEEAQGGLFGLVKPLGKLARPDNDEGVGRVKQFLTSAGYRSERAVDYYLGAKVVLGLLGLIVFLILVPRLELSWDMAAGTALVLVAAGFYLPTLYVSGRRQERQKAIQLGLPDTLDLLVTAVEAGLAIDTALKRVGEEMALAAPILSEELQLTALEMSGGLSRADAFRRLAQRTEVPDLKTLSAVLVQAEMFGTSVARSLRIQSDSLRVKRSQRAEEQAAKVAVKLTLPLIMLVLPSLMTVLMGTAVLRFINIFFKTVE